MRKSSLMIVLVILLMLISQLSNFKFVSADSQVISGSFVSSFPSNYGDSVFTVQYNYPKAIMWGNNFTLNCVLEINQLTGLKEYIGSYALILTMYGSNGYVLMGQVRGGYPSNYNILYAGSHWGPINITVPVNRTAFGNPAEKNFTSNLSLELIAQVQFANSINGVGQIESETNTSAIGTAEILSASRTSVTDYYLLAGGLIAVVAVASVFVLNTRRRRNFSQERRDNLKTR